MSWKEIEEAASTSHAALVGDNSSIPQDVDRFMDISGCVELQVEQINKVE